ncbi:MAG TPA: hypothetical protein GX699_11250 [Firmicutes bacterium]|nr:hypothetical protein [Bacillota bacterium]
MFPLLLLAALIVLSVFLRVQNYRRTGAFALPEHAKESPFSGALQELVAHAGGVYLSLVLLVSFLQLEVADRWNIIGVKIEPLAFLSILVAIFQPFVMKTYRMLRRS